MKHILVTGGCGFIGSNFIRYLFSEIGFKGTVINVDKLTYAGNIENLEGLEKEFPGKYVFEKTDICDSGTSSPGSVIHRRGTWKPVTSCR